METLITIISIVIVGFFLYGFHHDGMLERLEHKKLKELTVNDLTSIALVILLTLGFIKLLSDLFLK